MKRSYRTLISIRIMPRYDLAEYFIDNLEILKGMKSEFKNISDLERLNRKLSTCKLDKDSDLLAIYFDKYREFLLNNPLKIFTKDIIELKF